LSTEALTGWRFFLFCSTLGTTNQGRSKYAERIPGSSLRAAVGIRVAHTLFYFGNVTSRSIIGVTACIRNTEAAFFVTDLPKSTTRTTDALAAIAPTLFPVTVRDTSSALAICIASSVIRTLPTASATTVISTCLALTIRLTYAGVCLTGFPDGTASTFFPTNRSALSVKTQTGVIAVFNTVTHRVALCSDFARSTHTATSIRAACFSGALSNTDTLVVFTGTACALATGTITSVRAALLSSAIGHAGFPGIFLLLNVCGLLYGISTNNIFSRNDSILCLLSTDDRIFWKRNPGTFTTLFGCGRAIP
jgi:hypothetical protein